MENHMLFTRRNNRLFRFWFYHLCQICCWNQISIALFCPFVDMKKSIHSNAFIHTWITVIKAFYTSFYCLNKRCQCYNTIENFLIIAPNLLTENGRMHFHCVDYPLLMVEEDLPIQFSMDSVLLRRFESVKLWQFACSCRRFLIQINNVRFGVSSSSSFVWIFLLRLHLNALHPLIYANTVTSTRDDQNQLTKIQQKRRRQWCWLNQLMFDGHSIECDATIGLCHA